MKTYGVLNIVAHPHEAGTYRRIFDLLAKNRRAVKYFGDRFAAISPLGPTRDGVFTGRLATWTRIDEEENTIDLDSFEEKEFTESGVSIPPQIGFNSRIFPFAFNESKHRLVIETENDEGQTLSIRMAAKAFQTLCNTIQDDGNESIDVFIVTKQDAVDRILRLPKIKKITVDLNLPNPDDLSDLESEILSELIGAGAKRDVQVITKRSDRTTLVLTERMRAKANLAKDNGRVEAAGTDEDGETVVLNTDEYPEELYASADEGAAPLRRLAEE